jgi:hypothetical protein
MGSIQSWLKDLGPRLERRSWNEDLGTIGIGDPLNVEQCVVVTLCLEKSKPDAIKNNHSKRPGI